MSMCLLLPKEKERKKSYKAKVSKLRVLQQKSLVLTDLCWSIADLGHAKLSSLADSCLRV